MGINRKLQPYHDPSEDCLRPLFELSDFQRRKLSFYFQLLDMNKDDKLSLEDMHAFSRKMLRHADISDDNDLAEVVYDVNRNFHESLCERLHKRDSDPDGKCPTMVSLNDWLDTWAVMMRGTMSIRNFPYWVQLHVKVYFEMMDKNRDGKVTKEELREYYRNFIEIEEEHVEEQTVKGFKSMTANGSYPLNQELFMQNFANMVLGKEIYGPGEYIFGVFDIGRPKLPFRIVLPLEVGEDLGEESIAPPDGRPTRISMSASGQIAVADMGLASFSMGTRRKDSATKIPHVPRKKVVIRGLDQA